ncbi:MAG: hypothetical protein ACR2OL_19285, partial [Anderseniella sp.]
MAEVASSFVIFIVIPPEFPEPTAGVSALIVSYWTYRPPALATTSRVLLAESPTKSTQIEPILSQFVRLVG